MAKKQLKIPFKDGRQRGENFGIKLVKVLPGIHKCILRIAEKDIFGHESK